MLYVPLNLTNEDLMDRAKCFDLFRKSYRLLYFINIKWNFIRKNEIMEENK